MPVRERRSGDDKPLFRAVNERRLMGPARPSSEGEEAAGGTGESQTSSRVEETGQAEKGPITRAVDRAQQNNWVYPSMANAAREMGLLDKADEVLSRLTGK